MEHCLENLFLIFKKVNSKMIKIHAEYLDKNGIPYMYGAMLNIFKGKKTFSMTVGEIAKTTNIPLPHISVLCRNMEKDGFVVRKRDENDARVVVITLTDKAKKTIEDIQRYTEKIEEKIRNNFSREEYEKIAEAFNTIENFFERI